MKTVCQINMTKVNSIIDSDKGENNQGRAENLAELETAKDKDLKERVLAMLFIYNVDRYRYGKKYEEIDESSELERGEFPTTRN